jgi:tetratricopeptide (TPR) repeat protein
MLETIRQFAEEQLAASGAATEARTAHARYFAGREADILALWDSPRQREAYDWFTIELANLRTAFRWAADRGDLDAAAAIVTYATGLGCLVANFEPIAWAEELIEAARAADHPRLAFLYVAASACWVVGRIEEAVGYADAAQLAIASGRYEEVPFGGEAGLANAYHHIGQPERAVEWCRAQLARGRDTHTPFTAWLVLSLMLAGSHDEAMAAATGLIDAAEATHNPYVLSLALYVHDAAFSYAAFRDADPVAALDALRRGLAIAQDSGNRFTESLLAVSLCRLEAVYGDPLAALDYITLAIRTFHDAGNTPSVRGALSILAAVFDRLGRYEPAATTAGFAVIPYTEMLAEFNTLIAHLRDVLGDQAYESLARKGETMTTAAMAAYAYDQIDQARAELEAVSK